MYLLIKRLGDVAFSFLGLICLSPVLAAIWLAVRLDSPGPALFRQKRVGRRGRHFMMLKFRTMKADAPANMPTHLLQDPLTHITGTGRILRKTSLDELPQLWNILLGDMSIVGPRPALWNQYDLVAARERCGANSVRPGLTGLAQISGRDELPVAVKAAYDGEYCRRLSFTLDCRILWHTLFAVAAGTGVSEGGPSQASSEASGMPGQAAQAG